MKALRILAILVLLPSCASTGGGGSSTAGGDSAGARSVGGIVSKFFNDIADQGERDLQGWNDPGRQMDQFQDARPQSHRANLFQ